MCRRQVENGTIVSPAAVSGFQKRRGSIIGAFSLQTVTFAVAYYAQNSGILNLQPADEYCQNQNNESSCTRADLFAFETACGVMLFYSAYIGMTSWHITKTAHKSIPSTREGRLFGHIKDGEQLMAVVFSLQSWDLIVSMIIPELNSFLFLAHHFMASLIAYFSLEYEYVHHYALFAGGVSEISTIFLVFINIAKFFPPQDDTPSASFIFICQVCFAIAFLVYRIILWFKVTIRLWSDGLSALKDGTAEKYRPGKSYVLVTFLLVNALLGALQVLWFTEICTKAAEILLVSPGA
uniref:TLC domain-containing protein n=1 Tax=Helicotheca tamesis TaxID=374047 RepID=A0A7S2MPD5_9STRA|mmetsp:Transcript_19271/g.26491  ORF Transcript_19271/g.26491 Transcript_19271/m.26491 type:complete len:294 (+) Transcript_19271:196-1077(+)|eukprot:CAMPEP_0185732440 /NCGR_PEP_ID=MMETSP1171-20130828/16214_1 /TAXON_ID=374046 /ORGANISM="Helicotheca tamensis, Strain CCMP826" /LENGTH=293 /DNA_ID=CAMNT_0028401937 /DNA_START=153 /DNA_END=1034 /DNA_ORIENTATION=-